MVIVEFLLKVMQSFILLFVILIIGSLLLYPDAFGERAKEIFLALEKHGIVLVIGPSGATISRSIEVSEAIESQAEIDALVGRLPCLRDQSCDDAEQQIVAETLGVPNDVNHGPNLRPLDDAPWVVIFGADRTAEAAVHELQIVQSMGFDADLILSDRWFRPVSIFDSQAEAEAAVSQINAAVGRNDGYVRLLSRWCPDRERVDAEIQYLLCG